MAEVQGSSNVNTAKLKKGPRENAETSTPTARPGEDHQMSDPKPPRTLRENLRFEQYDSAKEETLLPAIQKLISADLSEPYSIYVYRYFLYQWGEFCFVALDESTSELIGTIICKLETHRGGPLRGYIAMLAVKDTYRGKGIATKLVRRAIEKMREADADEIALETETDNIPSLKMYDGLGFLRSKNLHHYYLNGNAAFRYLLYLKPGVGMMKTNASGHGAQPQGEELSSTTNLEDIDE